MTRLDEPALEQLAMATPATWEGSDEAALFGMRDMLAAVIRASPAAIVAADRERRVTIWNPAAERLFGWRSEEILGEALPIVPPEEEAAGHELHVRVLTGEVVTDSDARRLRKDGSHADVSLSLSPLRDAGGRVVGTVGVFIDLTERNDMRQQLAAAERRFRTLVEQIPAITYVDEASPAAMTVYVSPQIETLLGVTPQEWMDADMAAWLELIHPDDRGDVEREYLRCVEQHEPLDIQYRMERCDGRMRWFHDVARYVAKPEGEMDEIHGVILDITDEKDAELQLDSSLSLLREAADTRQRLLSALLDAETEERRRIAAEIHDDSIQAMTAVGLRLSALQGRVSCAAVEELTEIEQAVGESITRLRRLVFELRPPDLAQSGLVTTVRNLLDQARSAFGIDVELENALEREPAVGVRAVVYRVVQEAVANTLRHAHATRCVVRLEHVKGGVLASVSDDGVGFEFSGSEPSAPGKLGLSAMRERVELAGGWFNVDATPDAGTMIELWLPEETFTNGTGLGHAA